MPDREVEAVRDLIFYQYAKVIARRAFGVPDGKAAKGTRGLYEFYRIRFAGERKFYDLIPPLLEKKYLKTMYRCHECAGTLGSGDIDGDGEIGVLDVDHILHGMSGGMNWA